MDRGISRRRTPRARRPVLLAALTVLVAALTAGTTASGRQTAWAATAVPPPPALLDLPARPRVLLVGDSYTQGVGVVPQTNGFAYKVAVPLGWSLTVDGKGGSGYANPSTHADGVFADRLWKHPADAYDLVVLQGSSNDRGYTGAELAGKINMTVRTVQRRDPHARILMLGPTNPYGNPGADLLFVNDRLKAAARAQSILFIDPIAERWFVPGDSPRYANPANGHPNDGGYDRIASLFVRDVRALSVVKTAR